VANENVSILNRYPMWLQGFGVLMF